MSVLSVNLAAEEAKEAAAWLRGFIEDYDLSRLSRLTVDHGKGNRHRRGVWGRCYFPTAESGARSFYRISCHVGDDWPFGIRTRRPPIHQTRGVWKARFATTTVLTVEEGVVWIAGHELFHFLQATGQVEGADSEIRADTFANDCLALYRGEAVSHLTWGS